MGMISVIKRPLRRARDVFRPRGSSTNPVAEIADAKNMTPAEKNKQLNDQEYKARALVLRSYPQYVALNLSDVCTVCCGFCRYNFYTPNKRMVTVQDLEGQPWLKHPQIVDLFCGMGESLVNPHFKDIFRFFVQRYPYQDRGLSTNGTLLDDEVIQLFLDDASWVHVSVNAFSDETYRELMRSKKRDHVFEAIRAICQGKKETAKATPAVTLSYVAVRKNIEEFPDFVDYFGELGVNNIVATNYTTTDLDLTQNRRLPCSESLLNHKELADGVYERAHEVAKKYEHLTLKVPAPEGLRGPFPSNADVFDGEVCTNPWKTAYISPLSEGRWMTFCCTYMTNHSPLTAYDYDRPFDEVWNGDYMQWVRSRSVPGKLNPSCAFCKSRDLSDSANNEARKRAVLLGQHQYEEYSGLEDAFGEES